MPSLGMGTYPLNGFRLALLIRHAVKAGYRSFDTASAYHNEQWLGRGVRICGKPRVDLFITTKLSNAAQRRGDIRAAFDKSRALLGMEYVDLYLIHWPVPDLYVSSWKQMELLHKDGLARSIGVCNCHRHHLELLLKSAQVIPAVNQVELHPLLCQSELTNFCREIGVCVEAYSPLARMDARLVNNPLLMSVARAHSMTVPQVVLTWDLQQGFVPIPRSSNRKRLKENLASCDFRLSGEEMDLISSLDANVRVRHDPDNCDFSKL